MKYPNIKAIRHQLPHGAMTQIAKDLGISVRRVSDFFVRGWHKYLTNEILSRAVEIIREKNPEENLMKDLEELKLTSNYFVMPVARQKKKNNPGNPDDEIEEITVEDVEILGDRLDEIRERTDELPEEQEISDFSEFFVSVEGDFEDFSDQFDDDGFSFDDLIELYSELLESVNDAEEFLDSLDEDEE